MGRASAVVGGRWWCRTVGTVGGVHLLLAQGDPTGLSSPLGQAVVLVGLLTSLVLLLRWWWQQRRR